MKHLLHSSPVVLGLGLLLALRPDTAQAQTGIGTRTPDASAALDISSTSKGLLVPRVSLSSISDGSTVPSPATSLIVYNTNAGLGGGSSSFYGAGLYYNAGTPSAPNWVRLVSNTSPIGLQFWGVLGNTGTNPANNFLGTTDAQDLAFRVNNVERMRLYQGGGLGLGNATTGNLLLGFGAAASNPSGGDNSSIGINAGQLISSGFQNTLIGSQAGTSATTGNSNTFIGFQSGRAITNGSSNTFIGTRAGLAATGSNNTFIGDNAAFGNTSGSNNTAIGTGAGGTLTLGSNNTFIGVNANTNITGIQNSTAIGAGATVDVDNAVVLGTNGVRVGIGISTPLQALHVSGGALITTLGGPIGSAGDRVVVADASGNLSTRPLPGGVNDFVQNLSSASTAQNANFNINGTGLVGSRLGIGNLNPQQQLDVTGNGTFSGNLGLGVANPTQRLDVNGGTNISGITTIGGTLGVTGLSTLTGGFSSTNGLLSGSLGVNGQSTLNTVRITGIGAGGSDNRQVVITPSGDLTTQLIPASINAVQNQTTLQSGANFNIDGAGTVGGLLTAGAARVTSLGGSGTRLLVTDNAGNISTQVVPSAGIFNQTTQQSGANFNIDGTGTVGSLGVNNNANISGTLGVTGLSTLSSLNVTNGTTIGGTTRVTALGGSGTRLVVTNNNGDLSTQPIPAAVDAILNQNTTDQSASFRISGSGQVGTALGVGTALTVGTTLGVAGTTTTQNARVVGLANGSITANRLVGVDQNGNLVPTTATVASSGQGFVENRTTGAAQAGGFILDGSGTLAGTLIVGSTSSNVTLAGGGVNASASVVAAANLSAGANLTVGAFSRFGNNIGIGLTSTTSPLAERVTVNGNVVPQFDTGGELGLPTRRWNTLYSYGVNVEGNVVPGTDNTYNLGTSGARWATVFATNGTIQTSDARLKTNVTGLGYGLSTVMALRPVRYAWKKTPNQTNKIGFIAQELQQVVPEVVTVGNDANQTLGVNYAELVPVLVKALQEQQAQLDAMRGRAEKAEAAVQSFESRLRALEAGSSVNATAQGQR